MHFIVNSLNKIINVVLHKMEAHLGEQFISFVPNDYVKVMDSINLGRPHVNAEPSSKIALEIKRIASALAADHNNTLSTQPRKKSLRGIFGRQNGTGPLELATTMAKT